MDSNPRNRKKGIREETEKELTSDSTSGNRYFGFEREEARNLESENGGRSGEGRDLSER